VRAGLSPSRKAATVPLVDTEMDSLMQQIQVFDRWLADCKDTAPKGYITLQPAPAAVLQAGKGHGGIVLDVGTVGPDGEEGLLPVGGGCVDAEGGVTGGKCTESSSSNAPATQTTRTTGGAVPPPAHASEAAGACSSDGDGQPRGQTCPEGWMYADFDPLLLEQKLAARRLEFDTFDAALDEFYSKVSS
jgi:hypothetical protein